MSNKNSTSSRAIGAATLALAALAGTIVPTSAQGLVTQINPGTAGAFPAGAAMITPLNPDTTRTTVLFPAASLQGVELWRSDGNPQSTMMVRNIAPGVQSSMDPLDTLIERNGTVFFRADDTVNGAELWSSNGTLAGTNMVIDINPGAADGMPASVTGNQIALDAANQLWFAANDGVNGLELWTSDGTAVGTRMVSNIAPGAASSSPSSFLTVGATVYFMATNGVTGVELWFSDGLNTNLVANQFPGSVGAGALTMAAFNGSLIYRGDDGTGSALYQTTNGGTPTEIVGPNLDRLAEPGNYVAVGPAGAQSVFFLATTASSGRIIHQLLASGSVVAIGGNSPSNLVGQDSKIFFVDNDSVNGAELWVANRPFNPAITLVGNIAPGLASSSPMEITACGTSGVIFSAEDGTTGRELWFCDGDNPPVQLADITGDPTGSNPRSFTRVGSLICFVADEPPSGAELHAISVNATGDCLSEGFSVGAAGFQGQVPVLDYLPQFPARIGGNFIPRLSNAAPNTTTTLMFGPRIATPLLLPPCQFWVPNVFFQINMATSAAGGAQFNFDLTNSAGLAGAELYLQFVTIDTQAACSIPGLSFSNPMHVIFN